METQLLVIGDSQVDFWNGTGTWHEADTIPGVRSTSIPNALAWDLTEEISTSNTRHAVLSAMQTAKQDGFNGWLMFSFGSVDCETFIWRQTQAVGFEEAIARAVERYVQFILEARALHPRIAVWAPLVSMHASEHVIGNRNERSLAVLVFTSILQSRLASHDVPVFSFAEEALLHTGALTELIARAVTQINQTLRLHIGRGESPVSLSEHPYTDFSEISYTRFFDKTWLQFLVPEGAQFFTDIRIAKDVFAELGSIGIATTWDGVNYEHEEVAASNGIGDIDNTQRVHVQRYARKIMIHGQTRPVNTHEIQFIVRGTQLPTATILDPHELTALRDRIIGEATPVVEPPAPEPEALEPETLVTLPQPPPPVAEVIFSEPPSYAQAPIVSVAGVIFSEPPSMAVLEAQSYGEVIFSAPPGAAIAEPAREFESQYIPTISEMIDTGMFAKQYSTVLPTDSPYAIS